MLDALVNATQGLRSPFNNKSPQSNTAYYQALRAAAPEFTDIATRKKPQPPEVASSPSRFRLPAKSRKMSSKKQRRSC
jgi:hypothetical protein